MIELRRILVPCDFSPLSEKALRYGAEFAKTFGASLHVVHIAEDQTYLATPDVPSPPVPAREQLKQIVYAKLGEVLSRVGESAVRCVRFGEPVEEIVGCAQDERIDLIVIGTHGRGMLAHLLRGSTAEGVVRKAPCPVLTVHPQEHDFVP